MWSGELCCLLQPFSDQRETSVCLQGEAGAEKELELERELPGCPHAAPDHCLFPRDGGDRLCPQKGQSCKKAHRVPPVMTSPLPMAEVLTAPKLQDLVSCQPQGQSQPDVCGQFSSLRELLVGSRAPQGSLTELRVTQLGTSPSLFHWPGMGCWKHWSSVAILGS